MKQITVRDVSAELARRLKRVSEERGQSVNRTVLDLLEHAVGLDDRRARFARYATWERRDLAEMESAIRDQRRIDEGLWR